KNQLKNHPSASKSKFTQVQPNAFQLLPTITNALFHPYVPLLPGYRSLSPSSTPTTSSLIPPLTPWTVTASYSWLSKSVLLSSPSADVSPPISPRLFPPRFVLSLIPVKSPRLNIVLVAALVPVLLLGMAIIPSVSFKWAYGNGAVF